jgi:peptidoglycan L-alanyl-D-glutamate endopeptidase CwlK
MDLQTLLAKSEAKLSGVHPTLRAKAVELIKKAHAAGVNILITQGYRSIDEQNELYAQGRTKPGNIVTQVKGGYSYHNYGLAIDFAVYAKDGKTINWNVDKDWMKVGEIGESLGLEWGGRWTGFKDYPHFQLTFGLSIADLRAGKKPPQPTPVAPKPTEPQAKPQPVKEEKKLDEKTKQEAIKAIDELAKAGLITSPDYWKGRLEEEMPVWAYMIIEARKLKK